MWFRLFATALVPLTALIYFNAKIVIYYRENNFTRAYTVMKRLYQSGNLGNINQDDQLHVIDQDQDQHEVVPLTQRSSMATTSSVIGLSSARNVAGTNTSLNSCISKSTKPPSHKTSRERALFIMLCCITFTFFICHLPR